MKDKVAYLNMEGFFVKKCAEDDPFGLESEIALIKKQEKILFLNMF